MMTAILKVRISQYSAYRVIPLFSCVPSLEMYLYSNQMYFSLPNKNNLLFDKYHRIVTDVTANV